ncbi:uncharacterized protein [Antedon mediterranea]|uniref:uncharacterized protein n=1 Tax=Antedon mediterranea TaxID=105859 RepID=UPI003AF56771
MEVRFIRLLLVPRLKIVCRKMESFQPTDLASSTASDPPPTKKTKHLLRSKTSISQSGTILPKVCIICKKAQKQIRKNYKTCNQKLRKAVTDDAGLLRAAAEMKNDQEMLEGHTRKELYSMHHHQINMDGQWVITKFV